MNYLLDTHTLLWWLMDDINLSASAKSIIAEPNNIIFVSSATTWEITIKKSLNKLESPDNLEKIIKDCGFLPLPITIAHSIAVGSLVRIHDDPFDRIIIAQAIVENLIIITRDAIIPNYPVNIVKA
jgi:PIN domain nuclease of toxin-antitoxin system